MAIVLQCLIASSTLFPSIRNKTFILTFGVAFLWDGIGGLGDLGTVIVNVSLSPRLLVSLSPRLPISPSPYLPISPSPYFSVSIPNSMQCLTFFNLLRRN